MMLTIVTPIVGKDALLPKRGIFKLRHNQGDVALVCFPEANKSETN